MTVQRMRHIDEVGFAGKRVQPDPTWETYSGWLFHIFGDLTENPETSHEMLKELYCNIRSRKFDESFLTSVITGLPSDIICQANIDPEKFLSEKIQDPIVSTRTPFLIIGDVGVGKSTYLHHFFEVETHEKKIDHVVDGIIINFREIGDYESVKDNERISLGKLLSFIDKQINKHLEKYIEFEQPTYERLNKIFDDEVKSDNYIIEKLIELGKKDKAEEKLIEILSRLKGRRHSYNIARIRYLKRKYNKKFFLVLDNVDHLGYNLQINIFQLSKGLIEDYHCPFILTCREYTFPMAYKHMELSAFEPRFIHLTEPDVICVINKRKNFMLDKIKGGIIKKFLESKAIIIETALGQKKIDLNELDQILSNILESFLTEQILESLKKLSNTDTRTLLKLIKTALSSGYIYPEERRAKYDKVRYYDFIKALMLGNNIHYNPNSSIILNLFENEKPQNIGNNLIRIRLLQVISIFGNIAPIEDVCNFMGSIGYPRSDVVELIQKFLDADLIESPFDEGFKLVLVEFLRLTQCGRYYKDHLIKEFKYIQEIQYATYMPKNFYDEVKINLDEGSLDEGSIAARFKSTETFINFIRHEEEIEKEIIYKRTSKEDIENYQKLGEPLFRILSDAFGKA